MFGCLLAQLDRRGRAENGKEGKMEGNSTMIAHNSMNIKRSQMFTFSIRSGACLLFSGHAAEAHTPQPAKPVQVSRWSFLIEGRPYSVCSDFETCKSDLSE